MNLLGSASNLDVDGWLRGLFSAAISGGASAITGGIVVSGMDPDHYNFQAGKFYILCGTLFLANAVVSMAKFLQAQPLPSLKKVETTVQTITPAAGSPPGVTIETVKETHTEVVPKPEDHKE